MIVLDASVLIAFLLPEDTHHRAAEDLFMDAAAEDEGLFINPVTLAEVLVAPTREGRVDAVLAAIAGIGVREVPFPTDAASVLARLRVTGLKMPDCCVLMTAIDRGSTLVSFDHRLVRAAAKQGVAVGWFDWFDTE